MIRLYAIPALAAGIAFFVDQATKQFARVLPTGAGPVPQILTLVRHENHGLIANLPVPMMVILAITVLVLLLVFWMLRAAILRRDIITAVGLGILIGGALGNAADRLMLGYVFDWILLFGRSAINVADITIMIGALLSFWGIRHPQPSAQMANQ